MEYRLFTDIDGVQHIIIDREDGSQLSMTKAHYDSIQVEHLTEIVPADE